MATRTFTVTGMTCQHCVGAVTVELTALDGVTGVEVALEPEGASTVTVSGGTALSDDQIAAALDEAGDYHLASA